MKKIIYSLFAVLLICSVSGCTGSSATASRGMDLGNQRLDLL